MTYKSLNSELNQLTKYDYRKSILFTDLDNNSVTFNII